MREELAERLPDHLRAHGDSRPPKPPDSDGPSYWDQVGHFEELWQRHVERWPDPPKDKAPAPDAAPPGSWRGDGGRYLAPEQNARADDLIARIREPEKTITADLQRIELESAEGGYLVGLEHRVKGDHRLKEKLADAAKAEIGLGPESFAKISDAIRYTFCFSGDAYVGGYGDVSQRLEASGYQMVFSKNRWVGDPQFKGVNTRWVTPEGHRFEVQFHTPESFHAKEELTHRSYQRLRSPDASREERKELYRYQAAVSSAVPAPSEIARIPDVKKELDG